MRILITGISGFIASRLTKTILETTDHEVVSLDRIDDSGNMKRLTSLDCWEKEKHRVKFIWHDLKAPINELLVNQIGEVDVILHLAAGSSVDRSIVDPMLFVQDNIVGTVNLLEYARKIKGLKKFLYFSTDEVYGNAPEGVNFKEGSPHKPRNPYSAAKAGAEDMCLAYENTYGIPLIITNTMNVFGEAQHPEKFIPLVINSVLDGTEIQIHSHPNLTQAGSRYYIYVDNVADVLLWLLDNGNIGEQYNIVGEQEIDNLTLAQKIAKIVGGKLKYKMVDFHSSRPGHDLRYALDGSKVKAMGYEYPSDLDKSLERTVNWYLNNKEWLCK